MLKSKRELLSRIYANYYEPLVALGNRYVLSTHPDRSDIVHNAILATFAAAEKHHATLLVHPNPYGWVLKTFFNRLKHFIGRSKWYYAKNVPIVESEHEHPDEWNVIEEWLETDTFQGAVRILGKIIKNEIEQIVFFEFFVEGRSQREIATRHGKTVNAVKSIVYRLRKRARETRDEIMLFIFGVADG